jgi:hypothetical protein
MMEGVADVPDEILHRLYELPPEKFIAARDEAVAAARRAGDQATAGAIGKLRKPTLAAWLVNLLARRRGDLIAELLRLGEALRSAQHDLRGDELRELSTQRRAAIGGLVGQARRLAREEGRSGRENLPLGDVEATLTAALAEPDVAEAVRSGTLTKAVDYAGFGEQPRPRLRVIDGGRPAKESPAEVRQPARAGGTADPAQAAVLEKAAEAARTRAKEAQAELRRATEAEQEAARAFLELTDQLEDLRERHAQAQLALRQARLRLRAAQRAAARTGG